MADTTPDYSGTFTKIIDKDGKVLAVGESGTLSAQINDLIAGTKYEKGDLKAVQDVNVLTSLSAQASDPFDLDALTILDLPGAPTLTVTSGDGKVTGTYTDPDNDGAPDSGSSDITKRHVLYSSDGQKWTNQDLDKAGDFEVGNLTNDTEYQFKSTAENAVGTSDESVVVKATPKAVAVTGVDVQPDKVSVEVGKTTQLTGSVTPDNASDKTLDWSSSDTSIATVDSTGKVTGVKAGEATITAASHADNTNKGTSVITVTAPAA